MSPDPVVRGGESRGGERVFTLSDAESVLRSWHEFLSVRDKEFHALVDRVNLLTDRLRVLESARDGDVCRLGEVESLFRDEVCRLDERVRELEGVWWRRLWRRVCGGVS